MMVRSGSLIVTVKDPRTIICQEPRFNGRQWMECDCNVTARSGMAYSKRILWSSETARDEWRYRWMDDDVTPDCLSLMTKWRPHIHTERALALSTLTALPMLIVTRCNAEHIRYLVWFSPKYARSTLIKEEDNILAILTYWVSPRIRGSFWTTSISPRSGGGICRFICNDSGKEHPRRLSARQCGLLPTFMVSGVARWRSYDSSNQPPPRQTISIQLSWRADHSRWPRCDRPSVPRQTLSSRLDEACRLDLARWWTDVHFDFWQSGRGWFHSYAFPDEENVLALAGVFCLPIVTFDLGVDDRRSYRLVLGSTENGIIEFRRLGRFKVEFDDCKAFR